MFVLSSPQTPPVQVLLLPPTVFATVKMPITAKATASNVGTSAAPSTWSRYTCAATSTTATTIRLVLDGDGLHAWGFGTLPDAADRRTRLGEGTVEVHRDQPVHRGYRVPGGGMPRRPGDLRHVIDRLVWPKHSGRAVYLPGGPHYGEPAIRKSAVPPFR